MTEYYVESGLTNSGVTVNSGDELVVAGGGAAVYTHLQQYAALVVESGGVEANTVNAGGSDLVQFGGAAYYTSVTGGGTETDAGNTVSTTIFTGSETVSSGRDRRRDDRRQWRFPVRPGH